MEGRAVNLACAVTHGSIKPKKCDKPGGVFVKHTFDKFDKSYKGEGKGAWLTRDNEEREKFQLDALCGFTCSMGFYHYLSRGFKALKLSRHLKLRKDLPVLLLGGSDDRLSENGKLLLKLEEKYKKFGLTPTVRLYKDARHLILNEINKTEVYEDVINFINSCLPQ
jgi:alpha-beta hydrolase superfamily lysophospholipase